MRSSFDKDIEVSNVIHFALKQSGLLTALGNIVGDKNFICPTLKCIQKAGNDIIYTKPDGTKIRIDEKAQIRFINNPSPSFTLELYDSSRDKVGWFVNDSLETTHYMFIWVLNSNRTYEYLTNWRDINTLRVCVCNRETLKNSLQQMGYSTETLLNLAKDMNNSSVDRVNLDSGIVLIQSKKYAEAPINIKVPFEVLKNCSEVCVDVDCHNHTYSQVVHW